FETEWIVLPAYRAGWRRGIQSSVGRLNACPAVFFKFVHVCTYSLFTISYASSKGSIPDASNLSNTLGRVSKAYRLPLTSGTDWSRNGSRRWISSVSKNIRTARMYEPIKLAVLLLCTVITTRLA